MLYYKNKYYKFRYLYQPLFLNENYYKLSYYYLTATFLFF